MVQSNTEQAASGLRSPATKIAERTKSVRFERLMSFQPQVAPVLSGKEPCLRDMIHHYYALNIPLRADELTKQYIEKLWQANL